MSERLINEIQCLRNTIAKLCIKMQDSVACELSVESGVNVRFGPLRPMTAAELVVMGAFIPPGQELYSGDPLFSDSLELTGAGTVQGTVRGDPIAEDLEMWTADIIVDGDCDLSTVDVQINGAVTVTNNTPDGDAGGGDGGFGLIDFNTSTPVAITTITEDASADTFTTTATMTAADILAGGTKLILSLQTAEDDGASSFDIVDFSKEVVVTYNDASCEPTFSESVRVQLDECTIEQMKPKEYSCDEPLFVESCDEAPNGCVELFDKQVFPNNVLTINVNDNVIQLYEGVTDTTTVLTTAPHQVQSSAFGAAAMAADDECLWTFLYVAGVRELWKYTYATDTWAAVMTDTSAIVDTAGMGYYDGNLYIAEGSTGTPEIQVLDTATYTLQPSVNITAQSGTETFTNVVDVDFVDGQMWLGVTEGFGFLGMFEVIGTTAHFVTETSGIQLAYMQDGENILNVSQFGSWFYNINTQQETPVDYINFGGGANNDLAQYGEVTVICTPFLRCYATKDGVTTFTDTAIDGSAYTPLGTVEKSCDESVREDPAQEPQQLPIVECCTSDVPLNTPLQPTGSGDFAQVQAFGQANFGTGPTPTDAQLGTNFPTTFDDAVSGEGGSGDSIHSWNIPIDLSCVAGNATVRVTWSVTGLTDSDSGQPFPTDFDAGLGVTDQTYTGYPSSNLVGDVQAIAPNAAFYAYTPLNQLQTFSAEWSIPNTATELNVIAGFQANATPANSMIFESMSVEIIAADTSGCEEQCSEAVQTLGCLDADILSALGDISDSVSSNTAPDYTALLTNIQNSTAAIDANTDTVEALLSTIDTTLGTLDSDDDAAALATINTSILNAITELQAIDANTDTLEALLTALNVSLIAEGDQTQALLTAQNTVLSNILAEMQNQPDQTHAIVTGTGNVPAGLKSVTINNITGNTTVAGGYVLGNGRRDNSISLNATEVDPVRGLLPAITVTGGTSQWIGIQPIAEI